MTSSLSRPPAQPDLVPSSLTISWASKCQASSSPSTASGAVGPVLRHGSVCLLRLVLTRSLCSGHPGPLSISRHMPPALSSLPHSLGPPCLAICVACSLTCSWPPHTGPSSEPLPGTPSFSSVPLRAPALHNGTSHHLTSITLLLAPAPQWVSSMRTPQCPQSLGLPDWHTMHLLSICCMNKCGIVPHCVTSAK